MFESKHSRNKRLVEKRSNMFGVKEGHTIFCDEDCSFTHHEILLSLMQCKRNDQRTFDRFKECVQKLLASGWKKNSDIPDDAKYFRFPLLHWAAVYGKLYALQWLLEQGFDVEVTNNQGETALHRLVACQAHERAVDTRVGRGRRYSLGNIIQVFSKVLDILTGRSPQILLRYDYVERSTPIVLCLKLLFENIDTCQRLVQYYQALFKVLCERLVKLIEQGKISEEFVRNGFSLKDSSGNTIWHLAASCRNDCVTSSLNYVMNSVEGFDLSISNSGYETPILVALKNNNQEFAAVIEAYKFSNCSIPIIKMEMLSDSEKDECCCEHRSNVTQQSMAQGNVCAMEDALDRCTGLCVSSSHNETPLRQNVSVVRDEHSFTEQLRSTAVAELEKVVLTDTIGNDESRQDTSGNSDSRMEVYSTSQDGGSCDRESIDEACEQEGLIIEKQIDLCLSVSQSTESSDLTTVDEDMNHDLVMESHPDELQQPGSSTAQHNSEGLNILAEALRHADVSDHVVFLERLDPESVGQHIQLPTPPDSSTSPDQVEQNLKEPQTPPSKENTVCKGISLTPVLLIKLLSEPDVSEKFQSLLKDVITGDTEKVDSTQNTLKELKSSKSSLDCEIISSEDVLKAIRTKKEELNETIRKLQQEVTDLQASEDLTLSKLSQLKKEQAQIAGRIEECESTCSRLKRRLSDCTGALIGLSPKSQKKC